MLYDYFVKSIPDKAKTMKILLTISMLYGFIILFPSQSWAQKQSITQPSRESVKNSPYLLEPLTGGEYTVPAPYIKGHPYIHQQKYVDGSFMVNQKKYSKIPLNYDILQDLLITFHPIHHKGMILHHDKVEYFELGEQGTFIHLKENPGYPWHRNGIYELIWEKQGKQLIAKHYKTVELKNNQTDKPHYYQRHSHIFLIENGEIIRVKGKNHLITVMDLHKRQVKKELRARKIKYTDNKTAYLKAIKAHFQP